MADPADNNMNGIVQVHNGDPLKLEAFDVSNPWMVDNVLFS